MNIKQLSWSEKYMLSLTEEMTGKDIMKLRGVSFSKAQTIRNKAVEYCLIHDIEIGAKKVPTEVVLIVTGHDINYYYEKMLLEAKQVRYECI